MKFVAEILLSGKTATGIVVPPDIVEGLGAGKKPKVVVRLKDYTYRSSIAVMGGDFMIPVSGEVRTKAGLTAGERVEVEVSLDTEERVVTVPSNLKQLLSMHPDAEAKFRTLSYSKQRAIVLSIDSAKTDETRQRRLKVAIDSLKG